LSSIDLIRVETNRFKIHATQVSLLIYKHNINAFFSVRRAIENTARPIEGAEVFALGQGLIQVNKAFAYTQTFPLTTEQNVRVDVATAAGQRGIYLREYEESRKVTEATVNVKTVFPEETDNRTKVAYEKRVLLKSTQPWVQVPKFLVSANEGTYIGQLRDCIGHSYCNIVADDL
jgi:hypothetical protein